MCSSVSACVPLFSFFLFFGGRGEKGWGWRGGKQARMEGAGSWKHLALNEKKLIVRLTSDILLDISSFLFLMGKARAGEVAGSWKHIIPQTRENK